MPTPVGTMRTSSRNVIRAGTAIAGGPASSDSATGATARQIRIAATREAGEREWVDGAEHQLSQPERAHRDEAVDGEQAAAVLVAGQLVEPRLGDDVLPGEAQPGEEPHRHPRRRGDDQSEGEDRRRQDRRQQAA